MQTAVGRDEALASAPTFSRLENRATRAQAWALHGVLIDQFIASRKTAPKELVLDIDASDVPLHGSQELSQFHAYYDHHCYLPLYVFCGQAMLACCLRPSKIDGAKHAAALIELLVTRLRRAWPDTHFIVRGDSGFCRRRLLQWCERARVGYVIGLARNARLHAAVELAEASVADAYSRQRRQATTDRRVQLRGQKLEPASSRGWSTATKVPTHASSTPTSRAKPSSCTTTFTASAARPRTASRKRSSICSARARVARASSTTTRYFSSCPSDSTSRWTPCPPRNCGFGGCRSALAVSSFRLRARVGLSIPSILSPAREALPPRSDMAPLIRASEGLEPS
jgi:hypothetical protein